MSEKHNRYLRIELPDIGKNHFFIRQKETRPVPVRDMGKERRPSSVSSHVRGHNGIAIFLQKTRKRNIPVFMLLHTVNAHDDSLWFSDIKYMQIQFISVSAFYRFLFITHSYLLPHQVICRQSYFAAHALSRQASKHILICSALVFSSAKSGN